MLCFINHTILQWLPVSPGCLIIQDNIQRLNTNINLISDVSITVCIF